MKNYHVSGERERRRHRLSAQGRTRARPTRATASKSPSWRDYLPKSCTARAKCWPNTSTPSESAVSHLAKDEAGEKGPIQLTIFTPLSQKIVDRIKETDLNGISPLEALNLLHELKKQMD